MGNNINIKLKKFVLRQQERNLLLINFIQMKTKYIYYIGQC